VSALDSSMEVASGRGNRPLFTSGRRKRPGPHRFAFPISERSGRAPARRQKRQRLARFKDERTNAIVEIVRGIKNRLARGRKRRRERRVESPKRVDVVKTRHAPSVRTKREIASFDPHGNRAKRGCKLFTVLVAVIGRTYLGSYSSERCKTQQGAGGLAILEPSRR